MVIRLPRERAIQVVRLLVGVAENIRQNPSSISEFADIVGDLHSDDAARTAQIVVEALKAEKDLKLRWWLAAGLCLVAKNMDVGDANRICGPVATDMAKAIATEKHVEGYDKGVYNAPLVEGFAEIGSRLDVARATECANLLDAALRNEPNEQVQIYLANALSSVASKMAPAVRSPLCRHSASIPLTTLISETDSNVCYALSNAIGTVVGLLEPVEAERVCGQAAEALTAAMQREANFAEISSLAHAIPLLADRLEPARSATICARAAELVAGQIEQSGYQNFHAVSLGTFSELAVRLDPAKAVQLSNDLIRRVLRIELQNSSDDDDRDEFDGIMVALLPWLRFETARACSYELSSLRFAANDLNNWLRDSESGGIANGNRRINSLNALLTETVRPQPNRRARLAYVITGPVAGATSVPARTTTEVSQCRLTTQELVELLKMPTCFGDAREVVLGQLSNRYGQKFVNHWAFVRFAREQNLGLDFTTPPKRPDPKESLERMLKALDGAK